MDRRRFLTESAGVSALVLTGSARGAAPEPTAYRPAGPREPAQSDERFETAARLVQQKIEELRIPGAALGVVKDGRTTMRSFGVADAEQGHPVTTDTLFPLASLSKTVTSTAVMKLVEQGRVRLDAPVQSYVPRFRVADPEASRRVTVLHLLTHTPGWEGQLTPEDKGLASLEYFAETTMPGLPQISAPGSVWSYNNAGFALAGRLLETVTGSDIHTALRDLVFRPLGLTRAFTRIGDVVTYPFAQGHRPAGGSNSVVRPFLLGSSVTAGGVAMSLRDLLAYARFHLGDQSAGGAGYLSAETLASMREPLFRKEPTGDAMGIGWHIRQVGAVTTYMHGGTAGAGHRLLLELVPERNLAFAVLTNQTEAWRLVQAVEREILRVYESVALSPSQAICHRGINEAMNDHATPLPTQPDPAPYVGRYRRPPLGDVVVRAEEGTVVVGGNPATPGSGARLAFYGPDVAYVTSGDGYVGYPYEFIRTSSGEVGWIRVNGRVARKEG